MFVRMYVPPSSLSVRSYVRSPPSKFVFCLYVGPTFKILFVSTAPLHVCSFIRMEEEEVVSILPVVEEHVPGSLIEKYDPVSENDNQETRTQLTNIRPVGPGISAKMKLLFEGKSDHEEQPLNMVAIDSSQVGVVMDRVEELERTVLITRRKRKGQSKENGVRSKRIDDLFRAGSQSSKKQKLSGEPTKE